jgi:putative protein-disulfide isomerase
LHYIYDPICGWCYGAAPLLKAAAEHEDLHIELHAGGMMMGPRRQPVTPALRQFVLPHDQRIAELSGQPFSDAYTNGLLNDEGAVFDSEPPIAAILAATSLTGEGLKMLDRIQRAHFIEGRRISERIVLESLAADTGLNQEQFTLAMEKCSLFVQQHVEQSRALLHKVGGGGFPTYAYESGGVWTLLDSSRFLGRVPEWSASLKKMQT